LSAAQRILLTGATGYIGGRLAPLLVARGHSVRCLVRDAARLADRPWAPQVEIVEGDVLVPASLPAALEGVETAYYLIHAMAAGLKAARAIDDWVRLGTVRFFPRSRMRQILRDNNVLASDVAEIPVKSEYRVHHPELDPNIRRQMFEEVERPITRDEAYHEAKRCMRCYRVYSVITAQPVPESHN